MLERARQTAILFFIAVVCMLASNAVSANGSLGRGAPPGGGAKYREGYVIVKPKKGPASEKLWNLHAGSGAGVEKKLGGDDGIQLVRLPKGARVEEFIAKYAKSGLVEYAEPDYRVYSHGTTPNDPLYLDGTLWGLNNPNDADIDAPEAWDILHGASDVVVAVIDTGVRYTHEDLHDNMWVNPGEIPGNGLDDDGNGYIDDVYGVNAIVQGPTAENPMDDHGHGTHVAGTIGGVGNNGTGIVGVAWKVKIMACKFLDAGGSGYTSDAIECIDYARRMGARIINASWGGGEYSQSLRDAIAGAGSAGVIFVASAGNTSSNNDTIPSYPCGYDSGNIISVAATDRNDELASFSSYGLQSVDLAAPGVSITSSWNRSDSDYFTANGTSMAAPHVAGALAVMAARFPGESHYQLIGRLLNSVDKLPELGSKCLTGGRLNLNSALTLPPGGLQILPAAGLTFGGPERGPFSPPQKLIVSNFGPSPAPWYATRTQNWLSFSPTNATIPPGMSIPVNVQIDPMAASLLKPGLHSATITFHFGGKTVSRQVRLSVGRMHVKPNAPGPVHDGSSWNTAFKTAQEGLDAAVFNQEVWIAAGNYAGRFTIRPTTKCYGGFAGNETQLNQRNPQANVTTLDGGGIGRVVTFVESADPNTVLDGFTIRNGNADAGGGIACIKSRPTISNNIITGNRAVDGGAIFITEARGGVVSGNIITGNQATTGGAIHCAFNCYPSITGNMISGNTASQGGGIMCYDLWSEPIISGNMICDNHASAEGGGICADDDSNPQIIANKIHQNRAASGGGIFVRRSEDASLIFRNSLVGNIATHYGGAIGCARTHAHISNNLIVGNGAAEGAAIAAEANAFPLAVNNTIVNNVSRGAAIRLMEGCSPRLWSNIIAFNSGGINSSVSMSSYAYGNNCVFGNDRFDYLGMSAAATDVTTDPKLASLEYGNLHLQPDSPCIDAGKTYFVTLDQRDYEGNIRSITKPTDIGAYESDGSYYEPGPYVIVRVSPSGDDANDGASWDRPKKTISAAIQAASAVGGDVWVGAGTYPESLALGMYAHVYGGFDGTETEQSQRDWAKNLTTISGTHQSAVVRASHVLETVDGFTIQGGFGGVYCDAYSAPVIRNNHITGNANYDGAGVYCGTGAAPAVITNEISGNAASGRGGGVCANEASPIMINNTIAGNIGSDGGGMYLLDSDAILQNNIVAGNTTGIVKAGSQTMTLLNNCVFGNGVDYMGFYTNPTGEYGNISADPLFRDAAAGNYRLWFRSPCIDAGHEDGAPSVDRDGCARPVDGNGDGRAATDIGAYEFAVSLLIDVLPGDDANIIRLQQNRMITVAIIGTPALGIERIVPTSIRFGPGEATEVHGRVHVEDVNRDGIPDLILHFRCGDTGIRAGDTGVILIASLDDGSAVLGYADISATER